MAARIYGWVKYNAEGLVGLVCDKCLMANERRLVEARPEGVVPIDKPGAIICDRCGEVAQ